jgi:hypothetical protein
LWDDRKDRKRGVILADLMEVQMVMQMAALRAAE